MSRDALANLSKLPRWCYGFIDGGPVTIARGANQAIAAAIPKDQVDTFNRDLGVSTHQRLAMESGFTFGWAHDAADPDFHAAQVGDSPHPLRRYRVAVPVLTEVAVTARNDADAVTIAHRELNLPEGFELDGPMSIIDEELIS